MVMLSNHAQANDLANIPHVNKKAKDSYQFDYGYAKEHRAFAIAPGGAWSWSSGKPSKEAAKESAIAACEKYTKSSCVIYAVDNDIIFDKKKWSTLWGPYKNKGQVALLKEGVGVGKRFPNIEYTESSGKKKSIEDLKGKLVFVHIWGVWCPSCQFEFPSLISLYEILKDVTDNQVEFVVLQAREPIEYSRKWVKSKGFNTLPISDSGVKDSEDKQFYIKGGKRIADRKLAKVFPASYVLDKHGAVIFSHMGSISNWSQYITFFKHAVENSGK